MTLNSRLIIFENGQLFETGLFGEIQDKGVESDFFGGINFRSAVRGEQFVYAEFAPAEGVQGTSGFPGAGRVTVDDTAGQMLFLAEEFHGDLLLEEVAAFEIDVVIIKAGGEGIGVEFHAADHALCHGNAFCIEHKFFRAVTGEEVQHA